jgi:hypothetical protein
MIYCVPTDTPLDAKILDYATVFAIFFVAVTPLNLDMIERTHSSSLQVHSQTLAFTPNEPRLGEHLLEHRDVTSLVEPRKLS